jgi:hypothetical protein
MRGGAATRDVPPFPADGVDIIRQLRQIRMAARGIDMEAC